MSNQVVPFQAQIIVIAHDRTPDGLDTKMEALRAAIGKTGAEPYRPAVPTSNLPFLTVRLPDSVRGSPIGISGTRLTILIFLTCGRPGLRHAPISINPNGLATETKII